MIRNRRGGPALAALAASFSLGAAAAAGPGGFFPAEANFEGLWGDVFADTQPPGLDFELSPGDLISGSMALPAQTVAPDAAPPGFTFYGRYVSGANVSAAGGSFSTRYLTGEGLVGVGDNQGTGGRDVVGLFYQRALPDLEGGAIPVTILVNLEGPSDLFSGNDIPVGVTLEDFEEAGVLMMWTDTQMRFIQGELTAFSIEPVIPAPGAAILGAGMIGGAARRRRR